MDPVKILEERISHEIDMEILKKIGEESGVDLSEEIEIAEKKFNNHVHRKISGMTNKNIHERDNI